MSDQIKTETTIVEDYCGHKGEALVKKLGASYDPSLDVKDIAKKVRALIKKAIKGGLLPNMKTSVKISRFSGGCSLDVTVKEIDECVLNVSAWRKQVANNYNLSWADCGGRHNEKGQFVLEVLGLFVEAFQRSGSHAQSDYHNTNFFGHVGFDSDVLSSQVSRFVEAVV